MHKLFGDRLAKPYLSAEPQNNTTSSAITRHSCVARVLRVCSAYMADVTNVVGLVREVFEDRVLNGNAIKDKSLSTAGHGVQEPWFASLTVKSIYVRDLLVKRIPSQRVYIVPTLICTPENLSISEKFPGLRGQWIAAGPSQVQTIRQITHLNDSADEPGKRASNR